MDLFDNTILCKNCHKQMKKGFVDRDGFHLRALKCLTCPNTIIHPEDEKEFVGFKNLKNKQFKVKLRFVGNSYAVSIPREIVDFMHHQENEMDNMVNLCLEEMNRISLNFRDG